MTERSNRTGRLRRNNSTRASRRCLSLPKTSSIGLAVGRESEHDLRMIAIAVLIVRMLRDCFKSRRRLEAEILVLRHQPTPAVFYRPFPDQGAGEAPLVAVRYPR